MTIGEPEPNHISDHILDWLEDSVSFLPSFLDDPYNSGGISNYQWWNQTEGICQDPINSNTSLSSSSTITANTNTTSPLATNDHTIDHQPPSNSTSKREAPDDPVPKASQNHHQRKKQNTRISNEGDQGVEVMIGKRSNGNKKSASKGAANNANSGNNKEGRWAEDLLNPCAAAVSTGNLSRVQHLLYVLHELASSTGDANHRLAFYGLQALTHHLSSSRTSASIGSVSFTSIDPKFFQRSLLKFYEVSPWFAFPNNIANSSILQVLAQELDHKRNLHILDIGVSHGVQWPTLLEALTRRSGGPPPLVRITVITATVESDQNTETPFSVGPPGDNFSSRLLNFAKSLNINLQINRLDNHPLQSLNAQVINTNPEDTLVVCAQFRLHHLNHNNPDERTEFLKVLRSLEPKGVILSENNTDRCQICGDFATGFSRRVDYLWKFLDSTSSAFKGRESEERRVMEGEAAKALINCGEMNDGKEKWCERMRDSGFVGEVFGEDTIDGARALLRKYDSNWEMRTEEKDGCVGLWWKGQPVSFCSLWRLDMKGNDS
ncbi:Nodulation signaling pathway 1 protein, putative [Ricinus communis]|uniref:Nodulation signaling pathway 1 protein, putative n=1 Tax=Ricinus communis TaxID=3988 RepID=B9S5Q8_RICCO|nr:Nodulation signaling pathway 1 protein, putative [Ricinus communis]|eukprot:XP_002521327.1 nodulation-signaling pathway 1 protein [Ricinus communis]